MYEGSVIYKIQDKNTGIVYIGQTKNYHKRHLSHMRKFKKKGGRSDVYYMIEDPEFEILEYVDIDLLDEREIYWIGRYDSFVNGANMTMGGKWYKVESCIYMLKNRELKPEEEQRIVDLLSHKTAISAALQTFNEIINKL